MSWEERPRHAGRGWKASALVSWKKYSHWYPVPDMGKRQREGVPSAFQTWVTCKSAREEGVRARQGEERGGVSWCSERSRATGTPVPHEGKRQQEVRGRVSNNAHQREWRGVWRVTLLGDCWQQRGGGRARRERWRGGVSCWLQQLDGGGGSRESGGGDRLCSTIAGINWGGWVGVPLEAGKGSFFNV